MILITGINGFIAKHLYDTMSLNHEVYGTTKEDSEYITELLNEKKPEYIYHTGAEIYDETKMFDSNILLTYKILEYCKSAKNLKRLYLIGSSSEYGRKQTCMSEDDSLEPETMYEGTKAACTMLARSYSYTYNIPTIIIRPFTIYGPGEKKNKFIQILFDKKIKNNKTIYVSNGVHDYVYIDDFINALLKIHESVTKLFDIINIGSGVQYTNMEVIKLFEKVTNYYFDDYLPLPSKGYDSEMWVSNPSKLNRYYKIKYTLEDGLNRMNSLL
jgi:nucleoside-diphosphate-sugar epimerase